MTNDMIAVALNWDVRLGPPKCDKKDDPQVQGYIFPRSENSNGERKKLNPKAMIIYKRPKTIGQVLTNCKHLVLSKTREPCQG